MKENKDKTNIWLDIEKSAEILGLSIQTLKKQCRRGYYTFKIIRRGKRTHYFLLLKSLPDFAQDKYLKEDVINTKYSEAPDWAKAQAEKYLPIINASKGLRGEALKDFIDKWNFEHEKWLNTSYSSVIKMRRRFFRYGLSGLLSQHGKHLSGSTVPDNYFEYFKNLYLVEGAPSLRTCWDLTLGYAIRMFDAKRETFPSFMAFKRRLDKEIPKQSIYLARMGETAWNRKYGGYVERDYSNIICNEFGYLIMHKLMLPVSILITKLFFPGLQCGVIINQVNGLVGFYKQEIQILIIFSNLFTMLLKSMDCLKMLSLIMVKIIVQRILQVVVEV